MTKKYRDEEWLREKYINDELSTTEIAKISHCSAVTISNWLGRFGIVARPFSTEIDGIHKNREWLKEMYIDEEMSISEISEMAGCSESTIGRQLNKFEIEARSPNRLSEGPYADEKWLKKQYVRNGMSMTEIARSCGKSISTISNWIKKFGVETRDKIIDESGNQYGHLLVIKYVGLNDKKEAEWLCECSCGNETVVKGIDLRCGATESCGCYGMEPWESGFNQLLYTYRRSASKRSLEFSITKDEFLDITQNPCEYCGSEPSQISKRGPSTYIYNGIDRVNNNLGYVIENCVPCCMTCNRMKMAMGVDEFLKHIRKIHENSNI